METKIDACNVQKFNLKKLADENTYKKERDIIIKTLDEKITPLPPVGLKKEENI